MSENCASCMGESKEVEKITATYAQIVSRRVDVKPYAGAPYFEIVYFDTKDNEWHCGYGSFCLEFVEAWLKHEFNPGFRSLSDAIDKLTSRVKELESDKEMLNIAVSGYKAKAEIFERDLDSILSEEEKVPVEPFGSSKE